MTDFTQLDKLNGAITNEIGHTLHDLATAVPPSQAIVEIGSYLGKSTAYLIAGAAPTVRVFAVDVWEMIEPSRWFQRQRRQPPTLRGFIRQLSEVGLSGWVTPLQGLSTTIAETYDGPPIGLLYIDGDHRAGAARADFLAWRPHLAPGATVLFDDYGVTRNPEVAKDVAQISSFFAGPVQTINDGRVAIMKMP